MFHGFCLYYNRLENHSQWDKFTRFRSFLCAFFTVDIVVYNILFAIKYKISRKCNIHPNSMPKIHKSFQNGYNIVLFMQQISLYRKCPFFPGSFAQNVHFREKPGIFFIFHFSLCSRRCSEIQEKYHNSRTGVGAADFDKGRYGQYS